MAAVACSGAGVLVFNVFNGMNPVIIAQVNTPGNATAISCSDNLIAVADGTAGLAIIETPNPENLRVGACDFYLDPTHRNPVPPAMLEYVVRSRGFADVEVIRLHPLASLVEEEEGAPRLVREVDALLQGPRDYSVIMRRPAA